MLSLFGFSFRTIQCYSYFWQPRTRGEFLPSGTLIFFFVQVGLLPNSPDTREWSCLWKATGQTGHKLTGHLIERSIWPKLGQPLKFDSKRNWNFFLYNVAWIEDIFQPAGPLTFTLNGTVIQQGQALAWQGGHTDFEPCSFSHIRRCKSCVDLDEPLCQGIGSSR